MASMHAAAAVVFDLDSLDALRFSRPKGMISLGRFRRRFGYGAEELEMLSNMPAGSSRNNPFAARVQRFMASALDVVARRMLLAQDLDEAIAWFRNTPLPAFSGWTPERVVAAGRGTELVQALSGTATH